MCKASAAGYGSIHVYIQNIISVFNVFNVPTHQACTETILCIMLYSMNDLSFASSSLSRIPHLVPFSPFDYFILLFHSLASSPIFLFSLIINLPLSSSFFFLLFNYVYSQVLPIIIFTLSQLFFAKLLQKKILRGNCRSPL